MVPVAKRMKGPDNGRKSRLMRLRAIENQFGYNN